MAPMALTLILSLVSCTQPLHLLNNSCQLFTRRSSPPPRLALTDVDDPDDGSPGFNKPRLAGGEAGAGDLWTAPITHLTLEHFGSSSSN